VGGGSPYSIFPVATTYLAHERENTYRFATFARVARQLRSPARIQVSKACEMTTLPLSFLHPLPLSPFHSHWRVGPAGHNHLQPPSRRAAARRSARRRTGTSRTSAAAPRHPPSRTPWEPPPSPAAYSSTTTSAQTRTTRANTTPMRTLTASRRRTSTSTHASRHRTSAVNKQKIPKYGAQKNQDSRTLARANHKKPRSTSLSMHQPSN
jgi:hypothetical protein